MESLVLKTPVFDRLTDEEFAQLCFDNRNLRIERDAQRQITVMPPISSETGYSNNELSRQLAN